MPYERATKENRKAYRRWKKIEYPDIFDRSKKEKAEIHWCDYSDVERYADNGTETSSIGRVPKCKQNADSSNIKMLSTITNRGKMRFMFCREAITTRDFSLFLERLVRNNERKVFLILYNHQSHCSEKVEVFLIPRKKNNYKPQLEFFYLPSDLLEHNPIEESLPAIPMDILIMEKQEQRALITNNFSERKIGMENKNVGKRPNQEIMKLRAKKSAQVRKSKRILKPTI